MKGKDLKKWINKLSKQELEREVIVISDEFSLSLPVLKIKKAPHNLLWDGEDDPSPLHTKQWFLNEGYDKEDVESFDVEIYKGDIIIQLQ